MRPGRTVGESPPSRVPPPRRDPRAQGRSRAASRSRATGRSGPSRTSWHKPRRGRAVGRGRGPATGFGSPRGPGGSTRRKPRNPAGGRPGPRKRRRPPAAADGPSAGDRRRPGSPIRLGGLAHGAMRCASRDTGRSPSWSWSRVRAIPLRSPRSARGDGGSPNRSRGLPQGARSGALSVPLPARLDLDRP